MRRSPGFARRGYTLLEVLIASTIAVLLLAALYFSFDLTLRTADTGRALVAESDLNRAVINRMALDLSSPLGVLPPMSGGAIDGSSSGTPSGDTTTTDPVPTTTTATPSATTTTGSTTGSTGSSTTSDTATDALIPFQAGVVGTGDSLILFASKVPQWLSDQEVAADPNAILPSDAHRISYYLHSSGRGLCRQDRPWVTADKVGNTTEIDRSAEDGEIIAPEVVALEFGYADGTGYTGEWDGTQASLDGSSTTGPPRAIKVTITFEFKDRDGVAAQKKIAHVFPLRSAVGLIQPDATTAETP